MKRWTKAALPTLIGAGAGFVAFLFLGAMPGLLYGGYAGLALAGALFGTPVEPTLFTQILTFGGMGLGLLASLFLFLEVGAILGLMTGGLYRVTARAFGRASKPGSPRQAPVSHNNGAA